MIKIRRATEANDYGTGVYLGGTEIFDELKTGTPYYDGVINNPKYYRLNKGVVGQIQYMTPIEYFQACVDGFNARGAETSLSEEIRQSSSDNVFQKLKRVLEEDKVKIAMPYLNYSDGGFEQEGRHRMYLAMKLFGENARFPVLVVTDAPRENEVDPYLVNDGNIYGIKDHRSGDLIFGPSSADDLKATVLKALDEYPVHLRGKLAGLAWDAYWAEHPDDDEDSSEESATEAAAFENKFTNGLKAIGQKIASKAKEAGSAVKNVRNQMKYGTMDEEEIKDMGKGSADTDLKKILEKAKWKQDEKIKTLYKKPTGSTPDGSKYDILALTDNGGSHSFFNLTKALNEIDTKKTSLKKLLSDAGATASDKFIRFADPEKPQDDKAKWLRKTAGGRDEVSVEALNKRYKAASPSKKKEILEDALPRTVRSGKQAIIEALSEEWDEPFSSTLWQLVSQASSGGKDISSNAVNAFVQNEEALSGILSKDGGRTLSKQELNGLDLSQTGFQLKAILKFKELGIDLKSLKAEGGGWLNPEEMKEAIRNREYTDEESSRFRESQEVKQSSKAKAWIKWLQDKENMGDGKAMTLDRAKEILQRRPEDAQIRDWSDLTDEEVQLLVDMFGKRG